MIFFLFLGVMVLDILVLFSFETVALYVIGSSLKVKSDQELQFTIGITSQWNKYILVQDTYSINTTSSI